MRYIRIFTRTGWMPLYDPVINEWSLREKRYYTFASMSNEHAKEIYLNSR